MKINIITKLVLFGLISIGTTNAMDFTPPGSPHPEFAVVPGAPIANEGITDLMLAAQTGNLEAAQADLAQFTKPAFCAVFADHEKISRDYVNETNNRDETALMLAAEHGHINLVDLILQQEPNTQCQNRFGETAEDIARENYRRAIEYENIINQETFGQMLALFLAHRERRQQLILMCEGWNEDEGFELEDDEYYYQEPAPKRPRAE